MLCKDIRWANQTEKEVNAAKAIIAQLRNSFTYFDPELVRLLYVSLIRPHLEYAVPVWNPYLRKDIDNLENVQHRASRLCPCIGKRSYEERLKSRCQGKPHDLESGGSADHHGTNFFGFPIQNYPSSKLSSS